MRWADTSCPVCRYCLDSDGHVSHCATCNTATDLWICLICGHVGCGRYRSGHANNHWQETSHCYALELETQRVRWRHLQFCLCIMASRSFRCCASMLAPHAPAASLSTILSACQVLQCG